MIELTPDKKVQSLPLPTPEEIEEFKLLYKARFGVELTHEEAGDACARLIKYIFLTRYALPHLRPEEQ